MSLRREVVITISKVVDSQAEAEQIKDFVQQKTAERSDLTVSVIYHNSEIIQTPET